MYKIILTGGLLVCIGLVAGLLINGKISDYLTSEELILIGSRRTADSINRDIQYQVETNGYIEVLIDNKKMKFIPDNEK